MSCASRGRRGGGRLAPPLGEYVHDADHLGEFMQRQQRAIIGIASQCSCLTENFHRNHSTPGFPCAIRFCRDAKSPGQYALSQMKLVTALAQACILPLRVRHRQKLAIVPLGSEAKLTQVIQ